MFGIVVWFLILSDLELSFFDPSGHCWQYQELSNTVIFENCFIDVQLILCIYFKTKKTMNIVLH